MATPDYRQVLSNALERLAAESAIALALLSNEDGFLVAAAPEGEHAEAIAAISVSLHQLATRPNARQLVDEIVVRSSDRQLLVCRHISCPQTDLTLSVVVEPGHAYRRITNQAVRTITAAWGER